MKIQKTKSAVQACVECPAVETVSGVCDQCATAIEFIQSAISALSAFAAEHPDNSVATDSIANLGVVLLDLKSTM